MARLELCVNSAGLDRNLCTSLEMVRAGERDAQSRKDSSG
jgi:hypothetical protein